MTNLEPVIGLEVHAQLNTRTKLFCSCPAGGEALPNENVCEVCSGQPGALPRLNAKAVELAAKAVLALDGEVSPFSLFSRKNYFYPDLPNGFQTSQLDPPVGLGGGLTLTLANGQEKFVRLNRIHMEDDAGKCLHDEKRDKTLIDLNRAGTPLIEIVTEPDLSSSVEAIDFLKKLHNLLVRLEVTRGRLEEGEFRCDVNISLKPVGSPTLGVRTEIKNLNSFRFVGQAIEFEIHRQTAIYAAGGQVDQETLHFDSLKGETRPLRTKEEAHDYRYFPQPDLPPVIVEPELIARLKESLPLPIEKINERYQNMGLQEDFIASLTAWPSALNYFEEALTFYPGPKRVAVLMTELFFPAARQNNLEPSETLLRPAHLAKLARFIDEGRVSKNVAYDIFGDLFASGSDPEIVIKAKGLSLVTDEEAITAWAREVIEAHPLEAQKYNNGQTKVLSFLVGQVMRKSQGTADPKSVSLALRQILFELNEELPY
ncbi:MAG: Asp-tRNA(Asn)/Glu-tRNA(Gln) amidotransferase subunit GatB [Deltaproteobacteria bacterium]|jgi:aspartyl-tRNA(Asn)/glutamyl-tRNA(Gln) amidotransferase subunit B|nr:Asp-tRNA(Asn)/Glu-tRNA(Gln) amidotransferase subunit GatB [Deltaproteobacteria bacterium]